MIKLELTREEIIILKVMIEYDMDSSGTNPDYTDIGIMQRHLDRAKLYEKVSKELSLCV